ncbi:pyridoxamine 5'-phosphate oxidase family protein [Pseudolysinimonas sp.]
MVEYASPYLTLATASGDGMPWATPVWFAPDGDGLLWVSKPTRRHSVNIAEQPDVSFVVYDSTVPSDDAHAVYGEGVAGLVPDDDVERAIGVFSAHAVGQGLPSWGVAAVTGAATLRLYRVKLTALWVLDARENRDPVPIPVA